MNAKEIKNIRGSFRSSVYNVGLPDLVKLWAEVNGKNPLDEYWKWEDFVSAQKVLRVCSWILFAIGSGLIFLPFLEPKEISSLLHKHFLAYGVIVIMAGAVCYYWSSIDIPPETWAKFVTDLNAIKTYCNVTTPKVSELRVAAKEALFDRARAIVIAQNSVDLGAEENWRAAFKTAHEAFLPFGLVEESWKSYFESARADLAKQQPIAG
jgi:hypothetical protein